MRKPIFDLEERTMAFAADVRAFVRTMPRNHCSEDCRQLIRSSGSVGANYIEANESLSRKDFVMRLKIARKEAKESWFWLSLITAPDEGSEHSRQKLLNESIELRKILTAIISKSGPV